MTEDVPQVRLPPGLSQRILRVVEEESSGYGSFNDFILASVRRELRQAERSAYWARQEADR
ncbi:MAG: YlcI/YnfO family protein [Thermoplasmata archaeon]